MSDLIKDYLIQDDKYDRLFLVLERLPLLLEIYHTYKISIFFQRVILKIIQQHRDILKIDEKIL